MSNCYKVGSRRSPRVQLLSAPTVILYGTRGVGPISSSEGTGLVEKRYYNAASIERVMHSFERGYGLSSAAFYNGHVASDDTVSHVPGHHRQVWAGFYRTWLRLTGGGFAERADRELELA